MEWCDRCMTSINSPALSAVREGHNEPRSGRISTRVGSDSALVYCRNVGVRYPIERRDDAQSLIYRYLLSRPEPREFWALREVDFIARPGEIWGVVGPNGAGKTTLCRVICGLLRPDRGRVRISGEAIGLLSLGVGFREELTGAENIWLNGMTLGLSRKVLRDLYPEIVAFSGLGRFIDEPLKHYSSGMKSRLAFSVAAMVEPDILILDETLSVGDLEFSRKAGRRIQELVRRARLIIVVTHQADFVKEYCTHALWLDGGYVKARGHPDEVLNAYRTHHCRGDRKEPKLNLAPTRLMRKSTTPAVVLDSVGVKFSLRQHIKERRPRSLWALKGVSLSVLEGEIVGLIGRNGAGKTTLCRVVGGVLRPDEGRVFINGKISALTAFGVGFNHQLTGADNVYLNGMLLGIPKRHLAQSHQDIIRFSGLKEWANVPVKHYSSGMRARLGFSIAVTIEPDVLAVDEALSVGDREFCEKASVRMQELIRDSKAVIIATHSLEFVEKVCTRAVWIEGGTLQYDGSPNEATARYREFLAQRARWTVDSDQHCGTPIRPQTTLGRE